MLPKNTTPLLRQRYRTLCQLWLLTPLVLAGQVQPPAPEEKKDEAIELNPFVVNSARDVGYLAGSSLSGSRLATNLKDLAAPSTAFTQEFMQDIGITDTTALSEYMLSANISRGEDGGGQQNSVVTDDAMTMKFRGLPGGRTSINFFPADMRLDTFSLDRIDQSRGPNSILYGIGQPGGIINVSTKQAMLHDIRGQVSVGMRSWNGQRYEIDYNQPLIEEKLGIRVAALNTTRESWRNWEFDDSKRYFATATWQLSPSTRLRVEGETGKVHKGSKRTYTAHDSYTVWRDAGSHISDTANASRGIRSMGTANYTVYDTTSGQLMNWRGKTSSERSLSGEGINIALTDFNLLPRETVVYGPGYGQENDYDRWFVALTHSVGKDFNIELAGFRLDQHFQNYDPIANISVSLNADTSATLPNGAVNPNAGRAYLEAVPQLIEDKKFDDGGRLSASYQLNLGKWGRHNLAAVGQFIRSEIDRTRWWEVIVTNPFNVATPENANNRIAYRTYVDLAGPSKNIVMADWRKINVSGGNVIGSNANFSRNAIQTDWVPTTGTQITRTETTSGTAVLQSALFKERLHTVVGFSADRQEGYYSTLERGPAFGPFTNGAYYSKRATTPVIFEAKNTTFSAVYHVLDWLSLTYNQSQNSSLPMRTAIAATSTGRAPEPLGRSRDIGLKFDLFKKRVYITAAYYETSAEKDLAFSGVLGGDINPIWTSLNQAGVLAANGYTIDQKQLLANVNTFDSSGRGVELELIANLTPQWRLFANYSDNKITRDNLAPEIRSYIAENRAFWEANGKTPFITPSAGVQTVGDYLNVLDALVVSELDLPSGGLIRGQSLRQGNLRTTYQVNSGSLKGISFGGGVRYRGKAVTAYTPTLQPGTGAVTGSAIYRDPQTYLDMSLGYRVSTRLFGRRTTWSLQLNVNNVLDSDDLIPLVQSPVGQIISYRFETPREFILTARLSF